MAVDGSANGCLNEVSIPKRVSEVLWLSSIVAPLPVKAFQSLKGFQRFCGLAIARTPSIAAITKVSIPKRVSEVLWQIRYKLRATLPLVSIPKRVSEVLWL